MEKVKNLYLEWFRCYKILPKTHKYTLGQRIDSIFIKVIENVSSAVFLSKEEKLPHINISIKKLDALKILLMILWETKSLDNKKYIALSEKLSEVGKMLGGWRGQIMKTRKEK